MRRSQILIALTALGMFLVTAGAASAQNAQLRGHVTVKKADGTSVPAAGAMVDVYRIDAKGEYHTKADKKGQFVFAGLPVAGDYIIAASAADAAPNVFPQAKAGREADYEVVLGPGDGKRATEDEVKASFGISR